MKMHTKKDLPAQADAKNSVINLAIEMAVRYVKGMKI